MGEVGRSPRFGHLLHVRHQFAVGTSEVVGRVPVVVPAHPAEVFAQVPGHRHRHLSGGAEADDELGFLGDPDGASGLVDGQRVGDLHGEGGRDPVDLEKKTTGRVKRGSVRRNSARRSNRGEKATKRVVWPPPNFSVEAGGKNGGKSLNFRGGETASKGAGGSRGDGGGAGRVDLVGLVLRFGDRGSGGGGGVG